MKIAFIAALLLIAPSAFAEESAKEDWSETTLKEETIQNIQQGQYRYKKCIAGEMQKPEFAKLDSRNATEAIIKACEPTLSEMRKIYTDAAVPDVIADRHLKKLRIQLTRNVLQEMMYNEAAKKAGQL